MYSTPRYSKSDILNSLLPFCSEFERRKVTVSVCWRKWVLFYIYSVLCICANYKLKYLSKKTWRRPRTNFISSRWREKILTCSFFSGVCRTYLSTIWHSQNALRCRMIWHPDFYARSQIVPVEEPFSWASTVNISIHAWLTVMKNSIPFQSDMCLFCRTSW